MSKLDKEAVTVRLQSARLDEKNGEIVAHGWLDIEALGNLKVGDYQREFLRRSGLGNGAKSSLRKAAEAGIRFPDIILGMRGEHYTQKGQDMILEDDVYIVDGLQRTFTLKEYAYEWPEKAPGIRLGAEVRFATNRDSETVLFEILNTQRRSMSPSVVLRNKRNYSEGMATLFGLSEHDRDFPLVKKVSWNQQMHRSELMTALTFTKACMTLHRNNGPGGRHMSRVSVVADSIDRLAKLTGLQNFRKNIVTFFEMLDEVWGIRGLKYKDQMVHLKGNFLVALAGIVADHQDFWNGNRIVFDAAFKKKLRSFPVDDPTIIRLAGGGQTTGDLLRRHLIDHINKSKSADGRLKERPPYVAKKETVKVSEKILKAQERAA